MECCVIPVTAWHGLCGLGEQSQWESNTFKTGPYTQYNFYRLNQCKTIWYGKQQTYKSIGIFASDLSHWDIQQGIQLSLQAGTEGLPAPEGSWWVGGGTSQWGPWRTAPQPQACSPPPRASEPCPLSSKGSPGRRAPPWDLTDTRQTSSKINQCFSEPLTLFLPYFFS